MAVKRPTGASSSSKTFSCKVAAIWAPTAAKWFILFDDQCAMRFPDGIQDRFLVQRTDGAEVNYFGVYFMLGCEEFGCFQSRLARRGHAR